MQIAELLSQTAFFGTMPPRALGESEVVYLEGGRARRSAERPAEPLVRDTWLVREDARIEILTLAQAAEIYGVVLDPTSREVDEQTTERIRRRAGDGAP